MAHARALLTSHSSGRAVYVQADLHDPEAILRHPQVRETLDFGQPTALMLVVVLHFFPDFERPAEIVATLLDALPPGSYFVASHGIADYHHPKARRRRPGGPAGRGAVPDQERRGVRRLRPTRARTGAAMKLFLLRRLCR